MAASARQREIAVLAGAYLLAVDGAVFTIGAATFRGGCGAGDAPWVGIAASRTDTGYWIVAADGTVNGFGVEGGAAPTTARAVGIAAWRSGGYWVVDEVGGVFSGGDAPFHGSVPAIRPDGPPVAAVGIAATSSGDGYWIFDRSGGVFAFGDARFHGSLPALRLDPSPPISAFAVAPDDSGYWMATADGQVFGFGDVRPRRTAIERLGDEVVTAISSSTRGLVLIDAAGRQYPCGVAAPPGLLAAAPSARIAAAAPVHSRLDLA